MFSATSLLGGLIGHGLGGRSSGTVLGTAATVAGVAAVGGLAYGAYRHYQAGGFGQGGPGLFGGGASTPAASGSGGFFQAATFSSAQAAGFGGAPPAQPATSPQPSTQPSAQNEQQALLLVRAMIAAANIDGRIDPSEQQRILEGATRAGFAPAERQALERELAAPHAPNVLLGQVHDAELAAQFYLVTLLAVDRDNEAERTYVRALPLVLQIPAARVEQLHQSLGVPPP